MPKEKPASKPKQKTPKKHLSQFILCTEVGRETIEDGSQEHIAYHNGDSSKAAQLAGTMLEEGSEGIVYIYQLVRKVTKTYSINIEDIN